MRTLRGLAILGFCALGVCAGCGHGEEPATRAPAARPPAAVAVAAAVSQDVVDAVRTVGTIQAINSISLTSEVEGVIDEILFEESQMVRAGDVVVRLDAQEARAELEAARARRDRTARQKATIEQLFNQNSSTEKEYADIRAELVQAETEVRLAELRLEDHEIRAPFDGQVGLRLKSVGAYVRPGDEFTTLTSVDPIEVDFTLPERVLDRLGPGLSVSVKPAAYPGRSFVGQVSAIDSVVNPATRQVTIVARLDNPQGLLKPGMFVNVELVLEVRKDAVVVPETALVAEADRSVVLVVRDGKAERVPVRLGLRRGGLVEVREGLEPGEVVITSDQGNVRPGAAVKASPDTTLASLGLDAARFTAALPGTIAQAEEEPATDARTEAR